MVRSFIVFCLLGLAPASGLFAADLTLVDPLRPAVSSAEAAQSAADVRKVEDGTGTWTLSAILIAPERSLAVIDGHTLALGQSLKDYKLTAIENDHVVLQRGGRTVRLQRSGTGLKKMNSQRTDTQGSQP